jgi:pyruvate,water dikinase
MANTLENKIVLEGIPACPGKTKGRAKVIKVFGDTQKMEGGNILVTIETNPQYSVALMKAAAVVAEIRSLLSHAAIISREMGIPCVVNVKDATTIIKDNDEVTVDGTNGKVFRES